MPELPEVESLTRFLAEHLVGRTVERVHPLAVQALKTYDPPLTALEGRSFDGASWAYRRPRRGLCTCRTV